MAAALSALAPRLHSSSTACRKSVVMLVCSCSAGQHEGGPCPTPACASCAAHWLLPCTQGLGSPAAVLGNLKAGLREAEVLELPPGAAIQQVPYTSRSF
jgi:hypothetical protein